jgi:hypothetical protein
MRQLCVLITLSTFALALPLAVAAADVSIEEAFVQTMTDAGVAADPPAAAADVAVGHGTSCANPAVCASPRTFQFAAASQLTSGAAAGTYSQTLTLCQFPAGPGDCQHGTFRARVLCVSADASVATIGALIVRSDFTLPGLATVHEGSQIVVTAYDNGRGGEPAPDVLSFIFGEPALEAQGQCLNTPKPPMFPVVDGDIMVRDGQLVGSS